MRLVQHCLDQLGWNLAWNSGKRCLDQLEPNLGWSSDERCLDL
jgi:hypothetical protein